MKDYWTLNLGKLHLAAGRRTVRTRGVHRIARNVIQFVLKQDGPYLCIGWAA